MRQHWGEYNYLLTLFSRWRIGVERTEFSRDRLMARCARERSPGCVNPEADANASVTSRFATSPKTEPNISGRSRTSLAVSDWLGKAKR